MLKPKFIIADEPVSSLDVSIQAQILNLFMELQKVYGFSMLFISHDLRVVRHISDKIAVISKGEIVEFGETQRIFDHPQHEYTKNLSLHCLKSILLINNFLSLFVPKIAF